MPSLGQDMRSVWRLEPLSSFQEVQASKHALPCVLPCDWSSDSSDTSTGTISAVTSQDHVVISVQPDNHLIYCKMEVNKEPVKLTVDCGSTVCILPERYLGDTFIHPKIVNLQKWNKTSVWTLSTCKVKVKNSTTLQKYKVDFVFLAKYLMGLINVHYDKFK